MLTLGLGLSLSKMRRKKSICSPAILTPYTLEFEDSLELTFTALDSSDTYYTLDGSTPTALKTKYTVPFTITETKTIKWVNILSPYTNSVISSRTITKL